MVLLTIRMHVGRIQIKYCSPFTPSLSGSCVYQKLLGRAPTCSV